MFQKFYPSEDIRSTYDIDFERYYKEGYRGVIFDVAVSYTHLTLPTNA